MSALGKWKSKVYANGCNAKDMRGAGGFSSLHVLQMCALFFLFVRLMSKFWTTRSVYSSPFVSHGNQFYEGTGLSSNNHGWKVIKFGECASECLWGLMFGYKVQGNCKLSSLCKLSSECACVPARILWPCIRWAHSRTTYSALVKSSQGKGVRGQKFF